FPPDFLTDLLHAIYVTGAVELPAMDTGVTCPHGIPKMNFAKVHAQLFCQNRQMTVNGKVDLLASKAAKCTPRRVIGVDRDSVRADVFQAMHVVAALRTDHHNVRSKACVRAALGKTPNIFRNDLSGMVDGHLQPDTLGHGHARTKEILKAIINKSHGPIDLRRSESGNQTVAFLDD